MDHRRFDTITRVIASRRSLFGGVVAAAMTLAAGATPQTLARKKKKKKKCKSGTLKCGKVCVSPQTDALNCGSCGTKCGNGVACVGGRCGGSCPSAQTRCGNLCVDTRSDRHNCGACGVMCAPGETCSSGHCTAGSGYPCEDVFDCGGAFRGAVCLDGQCACEDPAKGLCRDPSLGSSADCNVCCPGGSRTCPGDKECNGPSSPTAVCSCPNGTQQCPNSPAQHCSSSYATDPKRCGTSCTECTLQNTGARCCSGTCVIGGSPGGSEIPGEREICGSDCTLCSSGTICCNGGPATPPQCVPPRPGSSVCPDGA